MRLAALFFIYFISATANAETFNYLNTFLSYWDKAKDLTFDEQERLWIEEYEAVNPTYFQKYYYKPRSDEPLEVRRRKALKKTIPILKEREDILRDNIARVGELLGVQIEKFKEEFSDVELDLDIYLAVGTFDFNGKVDKFDSKPAMLLSLEWFGSVDGNIITVMHEVFHAYHWIKNPARIENRNVAMSLYSEGLATLASERLYPGLDINKYLWFDIKPHTTELAAAIDGYLERFDSHKKEIFQLALEKLESRESVDQRLFFNDIINQHEIVPSRAGYYVGYLLMKELAKEYTLQEMAAFDRDFVINSFRKTLKQFIEEIDAKEITD